jgi:NAD(P)-dependent dehydrogenase (short-subunit alcohol dehydrogenase family)
MTHNKMTIPANNWPGIEGARVLVTGASSGLGVHFAQTLAAQGAHVVAAARRIEKVQSLCDAITAQGGCATALQLDVSDADAVKRSLAGQVFDAVINNAGTTTSAPALDHSAYDIDQILDTNVKGAFHVSKAAAKEMIAAQRGGSIINIGSILGSRVAGNVSAYTTSKAAVLQLTRALAQEWARYDIRVNAISPGYVETDLNRDFFASEPGQKLIRRIPQRRLGQPKDLDGALFLLVSEYSAFMTGSDIVVDGGHLVTSI